MAYETGTATGPQDLLGKLAAFLVSESPSPWVIDRAVTAVSPGELSINDGDGLFVQIALNGSSSGFYVHQSTSFDGSGAGSEPGSSIAGLTNGHLVNLITGPYDHSVISTQQNTQVPSNNGNLDGIEV